MINRMTIQSELGDDATLLTKTDEYLELQRIKIAQEFSQLATELRTIQSAQRIKRQLQQTNHVAVRCTEYRNNTPVDEVIKVIPLPDAIKLLKSDTPKNQKQINLWVLDGYDVAASAPLR